MQDPNVVYPDVVSPLEVNPAVPNAPTIPAVPHVQAVPIQPEKKKSNIKYIACCGGLFLCTIVTALLVVGFWTPISDWLKTIIQVSPTPVGVETTGVPVSGTASPTSDLRTTPINVNSEIPSLYSDQVQFTNADRSVITELEYFNDALDILQSKNWDGESDMPLVLSDFSAAKIQHYLDEEADRDVAFTIPEDKEDFYLSSIAGQEIMSVILASRNEYLSYARQKGVAEKYIQQFNIVTLPEDITRITFHAINDPDAPPTAAEGGTIDGDYSKVVLDVYALDIYLKTERLKRSGIIPSAETSANEKTLRDMAIRHLLYHEYTHVMQRAFETLNATAGNEKLKTAWLYTDRSIRDIDDQYFIDWVSELDNLDYNRTIAQESQAEGISYEMIVSVYNLSSVQKQIFWEYEHGRLENGKNLFDEAVEAVETRYPDFNIDYFGSELYDQFAKELTPGSPEGRLFSSLSLRLGNLPAYGGYFHPMLLQDTHKFWEFFAT